VSNAHRPNLHVKLLDRMLFDVEYLVDVFLAPSCEFDLDIFGRFPAKCLVESCHLLRSLPLRAALRAGELMPGYRQSRWMRASIPDQQRNPVHANVDPTPKTINVMSSLDI
jgi:hypothetical protein